MGHASCSATAFLQNGIIGCQLLVSPSSARERVLTPIATGKAIDFDEHGWADLRQFRRTGLAAPQFNSFGTMPSPFRSYTHERVAVYLLPRSGILTHGPEWQFNLITEGQFNS